MIGRVPVVAAALLLGACSHPGPTPPDRRPSTTAPARSTTTTSTLAPRRADSGLEATDRLERTHHLVEVLPHVTAHYRIDFTVAADGHLSLRVTLLAVLNSPRDLATYQAELRRYRAEALSFIEAQGDEPATYSVTFFPDPTTSPKEGP